MNMQFVYVCMYVCTCMYECMHMHTPKIKSMSFLHTCMLYVMYVLLPRHVSYAYSTCRTAQSLNKLYMQTTSTLSDIPRPVLNSLIQQLSISVINIKISHKKTSPTFLHASKDFWPRVLNACVRFTIDKLSLQVCHNWNLPRECSLTKTTIKANHCAKYKRSSHNFIKVQIIFTEPRTRCLVEPGFREISPRENDQ